MGAIYFYHLTQNPLESTLSNLLGRAGSAGWRVLVRGVDPARMEWLDQKLWAGCEEDFLPHGQAGGAHDALQPVLLTCDAQNANNAECIMSIDGADISAQEVEAAQRVCIFFDGHDPEAMTRARSQWKELTAAGCAAQYWSEESGVWEKKRDTSDA